MSASQLLFGKVQGLSRATGEAQLPFFADVVTADNPLVYWKAESSGNSSLETDYSENGFNAIGNFTPVSRIRGRASTQAARFDYLQADFIRDITGATPSLSGLTAWSLECIVKVPVGGDIGSNYGLIFSEHSDYDFGQFIAGIYFEDERTSGSPPSLRGVTYLSGTSFVVNGNYNIGESAHVVVTRNGGTLRIYVNGALAGERTDLPPAVAGAATDVELRAHHAAFGNVFGMTFTGSDFVAYDYALSAERVSFHHATSGVNEELFNTIFSDDFETSEASDPIRDTWTSYGGNFANWSKEPGGFLFSDTRTQNSDFGSFAPTGVTSSKTVRIRTKLSWEDAGSSQSFPNQGIHGQGNYISNGTVLTGYILLLNSPSNSPTQSSTLLLQRRDNTGSTTSSDSFAFQTLPELIYNLEMLIEDSGACLGKIWADGDPEPENYQVSVFDDVTVGNFNGVIRQSPDTLFKWYDFSIEEV